MIIDEQQALKFLKEGKVIGVPTDTVYGLAAYGKAIDELYRIKKRSREKKIVKMIPNMKFIHTDDQVLIQEMKKNWPGNVTYIYEIDGEFQSYRIPDESNLLHLLNKLDDYLWVTSANISGENPCLTKEQFEEKFSEIPLLEEKVICKKKNVASSIYKYINKTFERIR